jgi:hypothetical protein
LGFPCHYLRYIRVKFFNIHNLAGTFLLYIIGFLQKNNSGLTEKQAITADKAYLLMRAFAVVG